MPFFDGYEMLRYAWDADGEEKLFLRWVAGYQQHMGFEEFKREAVKGNGVADAPGKRQSADEILKGVKEIIG